MRFGRLLTRAMATGLALGALATLGPPPARADDVATAYFMRRFDVDSASVTYCVVTGQGELPFGAAISGVGTVTTASATGITVTGSAATSFDPLAVNDIIRVVKPSGVEVRRVLAKASATSLTVDEPVDWTTARGWAYWKQTCGTTATDGWISLVGKSQTGFEVDFEQGDIDGLEWRIECRREGGSAVVVFPGTATACGAGSVASGYCRFAAATAGISGRYPVDNYTKFDACRVGFKYQSTDTSDTGADIVVNGTFTGNATGWTLGLGGGAPDWAYSANTVTHGNGGGVATLTPSTPLTIVAGHAYTLAFTLSGVTAGSVTPTIGGTAGTLRSTSATFTETIVATTTGNLLFTPTTTFVGVIDTISVVDLTGANLEIVNATVTPSDTRR